MSHLTHVQGRHRLEQPEGPDVPHLAVGDDLETVGAEHPAQVLVQLVQLADLGPGGAGVEEDAVVQDQLVGGIERGAVAAREVVCFFTVFETLRCQVSPPVVVGDDGLELPHLLAGGHVVDGGRVLLGADDL